MNKRTQTLRICALSHKLLPKEEMFRVCKVDGVVVFDKYQNKMGRGVYLTKTLKTIVDAQKRNLLSRALRIKVDDSIYVELIQDLVKERR